MHHLVYPLLFPVQILRLLHHLCRPHHLRPHLQQQHPHPRPQLDPHPNDNDLAQPHKSNRIARQTKHLSRIPRENKRKDESADGKLQQLRLPAINNATTMTSHRQHCSQSLLLHLIDLFYKTTGQHNHNNSIEQQKPPIMKAKKMKKMQTLRPTALPLRSAERTLAQHLKTTWSAMWKIGSPTATTQSSAPTHRRPSHPQHSLRTAEPVAFPCAPSSVCLHRPRGRQRHGNAGKQRLVEQSASSPPFELRI